MPTPVDIFISVAEESADMHAAALIRAARASGRPWRFHGMTGPRLRALGVETVFDFASHAAMLGGVLKVAGRAWTALRTVEHSWRTRRPALLVLLDSPALHLPLARRAKRAGLPVLYYIAPQTWASREGRNRQIARDVDQLACILPFEETYFRARGVHATYVGHPLFESIRAEESTRGDPAPHAADVRPSTDTAPTVALLPGSRRHVIDAMLPRQLEVLKLLCERAVEWRPGPVPGSAHVVRPRVVVSCVAADRFDQVRAHVLRSGVAADIIVADNARVLTTADLVLVASGTATLHVAHYRKPMIVMYDAGRWLQGPYELAGRLVVKSPHLSLLNVLADARIVPEFMPFIDDVRPIADVAGQLLADASWRELMVRQIDAVVAPLESSDASRRVCELMDELLAAGATA